MNVFFHNPQFVWLAPAVAVPFLIHFLARAKPPAYLFSTTFFIKKVVQQTLKIKRPKDRLLLLVRTLLFLTLMLLFIRPVIFFHHQFLHDGTPRNLVIIIDRSASMNWSEGGRSRFSAACDEAAILFENLSSRDVANVVWLDREPDTIFPEPGANTAYLRERLRDARCSYEFGNVEQAVNLSIDQLTDTHFKSELCIVSDFQSTQWENIRAKIPEDILVTTLKPVRDAAENGAVLSIRTTPMSPLAGETAQVIVNMGNYSDTPRNRTVMVKMDEKRATKQVQVPAWGQASVVLEHVFTRPGRITVSAQLEEDAFGADDWRGVPVFVRHALKVGLSGDDTLTAKMFQRAFTAFPWVKIACPGFFSDIDLLVLAGWNGELSEELKQIQARGTPCLIAPSQGLKAEALKNIAHGIEVSHAGQSIILETPDKALGMRVTMPDHPALALFRNGEYGDPAGGSFYRRFHIPGWDETGDVLFRFSDGKPALIEYKEPAPVLLWLVPLDTESGNWAAQPSFLPFLGEILGHLSRKKHYPVPETSLPGDTLSFSLGDTMEAVRMMDDSDKLYPIVRVDSLSNGTQFVSEPINETGIYRVCTKNDCSPVQIVNFPGSESDLRTTEPPSFADIRIPEAKTAGDITHTREGRPLWPLFVWLVLLWIGLESLLVWLIHRDEQKMAKGTP